MKLLSKLVFGTIKLCEGVIQRASRVGPGPFFQPRDFSWACALEADWAKIRFELDEVLKDRNSIPNIQSITPEVNHLTADDNWKSFWLYGFGYKSDVNCKRCPATMALIRQIPGMKTAFFSILRPGIRIPPHTGDYNGILRAHLGLKIPKEKTKCWIKVGGQRQHWEEGKLMIFDDKYLHEVHNDTPEERVVLFLDFLRPLPYPVQLFNRLLIKLIALTPYVQVARKNQADWEALVQKNQLMAQASRR